MSRPKNPDNRYSFTCKVTGEIIPTNPTQFRNTADRYEITSDELDSSYVSRAGRKIIAEQKLSVEQAIEQYGLHPNVASFLKCTVKPVNAPIVENTIVVNVENVASTENAVSTEMVHNNTSQFEEVYNASEEEIEEEVTV